jgi:hypothetical protein
VTIQDTTIHTIEDYLKLCSQLQAASPCLFRGQTKDYGAIVPSLFRSGRPPTSSAAELAVRLYIECYKISDWEAVKEEYVKEIQEQYDQPIGAATFLNMNLDFSEAFKNLEAFYSEDFRQNAPGLYAEFDIYYRVDALRPLISSFIKNLDKHGDALLQHYGVPSRALDITYNPVVALWFATHLFIEKSDGRATFELASAVDSVVYVFSGQEIDVQDLRQISFDPRDPSKEKIPYFGLRGVAQEGGLIFGANDYYRDLRPLLSCVIRIKTNIWDAKIVGGHYRYEELFPSNSTDAFYGALLDEKRKPVSIFAPITDYIPIYV